MSKKLQTKANKILQQYPEEPKVIFTQDGQAFFDEAYAKSHHINRGFEAEPEVFFREGYAPEDPSDFEKAWEEAVQANEALSDILSTVKSIADTDTPYEPVTADTDETVTAVVQLREENERLLEENKQLALQVEELQNKNNGKTKTNSTKA